MALIRASKEKQPSIDIGRVQDAGLRSQSDSRLLDWAAANSRIIISRDRKTLAHQTFERIEASTPMPGVLLLRSAISMGQAVEEILVIANCSAADEMRD